LSSNAARQTTTMQSIARSAAEQVSATEQIAQAMRGLRGQSRDITSALGAQAKDAALQAADVEIVAREITALRAANTEQAALLASMTTMDGEQAT
jgi:hypothetical protein